MPDLSDDLLRALTKQAACEAFNSDAYMQIALFWDGLNYGGIAQYYRAESESERKHMRSIQDYITRRGRIMKRVDLRDYPADDRPAAMAGFTAIIDEAVAAASTNEPSQYGPHFFKLFKLAYDLECTNTTSFNQLAQQALNEDDHVTYQWLGWYLEEQGKAEDETDEWMSKAKAYGSMPGLFWHLDKEMGKHASVGEDPPSLVSV